jgi:hypothetical protein
MARGRRRVTAAATHNSGDTDGTRHPGNVAPQLCKVASRYQKLLVFKVWSSPASQGCCRLATHSHTRTRTHALQRAPPPPQRPLTFSMLSRVLRIEAAAGVSPPAPPSPRPRAADPAGVPPSAGSCCPGVAAAAAAGAPKPGRAAGVDPSPAIARSVVLLGVDGRMRFDTARGREGVGMGCRDQQTQEHRMRQEHTADEAAGPRSPKSNKPRPRLPDE